jgi:hypothetical protein
MVRKSMSVLLNVLLIVMGGSSIAWAQPVLRSGNIFHRAVCPGPDRPETARCHAHVVTDFKGNAQERGAARNLTPSGYGASTLRAVYNIVPSNSSMVIAIVDAYGYNNAESDLAVYRSNMGLVPCTTANGCFTKYNQSGQARNYPSQNIGWAQETALDLDMVSAMCPSCRIILIEANSASYANLAAAENTAALMGAHVISNSYGGGESGTTSYETAYNHAGIAITVSSGDSGYGVQFPASSPHVTAVGGTTMHYSNGVRTETAWADGGSGCSTVYAKPTWQTDKGCTMRMEADVSAVAETGVAVYGPSSRNGSAWQVYGGTSVAAPLIAGIYGNNGGSVNYGNNPYVALGALNDVTSGSNGTCSVAYFCNAGPGYDGPTGLGTPNGNSAF